MTAGVRFPTGVYPFGLNDTFPTTNSFPTNWNFSYNAIQSHGDPQGQIANQTPVQTIPVVQPATAVQSVQMPQCVTDGKFHCTRDCREWTNECRKVSFERIEWRSF